MDDVESHLSMFHFKCAVYSLRGHKEELSSCISSVCVCGCVFVCEYGILLPLLVMQIESWQVFKAGSGIIYSPKT